MHSAVALEPGDFDAVACPDDPAAFHLCRLDGGGAVVAVSRAEVEGDEARVRVRIGQEIPGASPGSAGVVVLEHDVVLVPGNGHWRFARRELRLSS